MSKPFHHKDDYKCEICCNCNYETILETYDYRLKTTAQMYSLVKCTDCGHVVIHPMPDEQDLDSFYPQKFYQTNHNLGFFDQFNYWVVCNKIKKFAPTGRLLDIGCGVGNFLISAQTKGYDVYGQEISTEGTRLAKKKFDRKISGKNLLDCGFPVNYFDIITLWHVAEHVYDINQYFVEIHRILKPNGVLVLEVPNFDSIERRFFGKYWIHLDAPRHLRYFTPGTLQKILSRVGFASTINNGWSFFSFFFSFINSLNLYCEVKFNANRFFRLIVFGLALFPNMAINLWASVFRIRPVIGAICIKNESRKDDLRCNGI